MKTRARFATAHGTPAHTHGPDAKGPATPRDPSAVRHLLHAPRPQPKLTVGAPNDAFEREADSVADHVMRMPEPGVQRLCPRCEEELAAQGSVQRKCAECEKAELEKEEAATIRPKSATPVQGTVPAGFESRFAALRGGGQPLPASERSFFEPRFGRDFSAVRVHSGPAAGELARCVNARAFTLGTSVVFGDGEYAPGSHGGRSLLAHELTHVVQQNDGTVRRKGETPSFTEGASTEFLDAGWADVHELGIAFTEGGPGKGGVNLRKSPNGELIRWLKPNTKMFILKHHAKAEAYAVSVLKEDGSAGEFGYVWSKLVWRYLPDPDSDVVKVHSGESPIEIAGEHYKGKGFDVWAKDKRYVVNALVWVNQRAHHNAGSKSGISKEALDDKWYTAKSTAGIYIWLPGVDFMNVIYDQVVKHGGGTGSISGDLWQTIKQFAHGLAYGLAFVGGLLHGFIKSLVDAVVGLVTTAKDVLVSIFTGSVLSDAKELWTAISSITWEQIKEAVGTWAEGWDKKLNSKSPWVAGHAHGYLTGYVMAEAAQLLLSAGTLAALKGALWASRFGKAIKATSAMQRLASGIEKAGEVGSKLRKGVVAAGKAVVKSKPFTVLAHAKKWIGDALLLSAETLGDLSLEAINRLRSLSDDALERLRQLAQPFKRVILGCASPCKVDMDEVNAWVKALATKAGASSTPLTTNADVLAALPAAMDKSLIASKLAKHPTLLDAIKRAGLTAEDFAVIESKFLTEGDKFNPKTAYETFTRTMTTLVPVKVGPDVDKMLEISKALTLLEPKYASSLKGPLFETFAKLHLGRFRGIRFGRATWDKATHTMLWQSRTSDGFIDSAGAIWDFKDTAVKLDGGGQIKQIDDYFKIVTQGLASTDGKKATSVNFVFSTLKGAEENRHLLTKGFNIFYVTPPDVVSKLK